MGISVATVTREGLLNRMTFFTVLVPAIMEAPVLWPQRPMVVRSLNCSLVATTGGSPLSGPSTWSNMSTYGGTVGKPAVLA